jgi:integrase
MSNEDRCILTRRGQIELSKYWPDGTRFRRVFPNKTAARAMRARIETAIAFHTWRELKEELSENPRQDLTFKQFREIYLEHCRAKNRRCDFHEEEIDRYLPKIGNVRLNAFTRADAVRLQEWRTKQSVSPATVNRMMKVLSSMLSYAFERGDITTHPMLRFKHFPEAERELRVMTIDEERAFVAALLKIDLAVFGFAAIMGETALRPSEAERLEWPHVDLTNRILTVNSQSKGKRARYIPLSDFAVDVLRKLTRVAEDPHVFVRLETLKPVQDVREPFAKAQKATGLDWVHPEDFRHFRATQWVRLGIDLKTVQRLLGHRDIRTTMRYAHFAPEHANRTIVDAQREEAQSLRQLVIGFERTGPKQDQEVSELERLYRLETAKA